MPSPQGLLRLEPFGELPSHFHPAPYGEIYHFTRGNGQVSPLAWEAPNMSRLTPASPTVPRCEPDDASGCPELFGSELCPSTSSCEVKLGEYTPEMVTQDIQPGLHVPWAQRFAGKKGSEYLGPLMPTWHVWPWKESVDEQLSTSSVGIIRSWYRETKLDQNSNF